MHGISIYAEFSDEQTKKNFEKAERYKLYIYEDARGYKYAMGREDYNKAVVEAEQVAEKSLKAIAQKNGRLSNTMKGRHGHDLLYLARECGTNILIPKDKLAKLGQGYYKARYPDGGKIYNKNEAEECGETACEVMDILIKELDIPSEELDREIGGKKVKESIDDFGSWNRLMKQ